VYKEIEFICKCFYFSRSNKALSNEAVVYDRVYKWILFLTVTIIAILFCIILLSVYIFNIYYI
jgi:hypothetical protein